MFGKIIPIYGDITAPGLGLSEFHREKVVSSTQIVFHIAACVSFTAPLKTSITANLIGTKNVIELSKKMSNLLVVIHLSTAFCNFDQDVVESTNGKKTQKS
jgi:alcohol-forming fatty acyl-CoA reductase